MRERERGKESEVLSAIDPDAIVVAVIAKVME
jgi:hypothetical protein